MSRDIKFLNATYSRWEVTIKITTRWNVARLKFAEHIKISRADVAILQRKIIKSNGLFVCNIYAACVRVCEVVR